MVRLRRLLMVIVMMTAAAFADEASKTPVVRTAGLALGSTTFSFKDSASRDYGPVILNGSGPCIRAFYKRERRNKIQALSLNFNSIGDFSHDTGAREIRLPAGTRFADIGLEYG